MPVSLSQQTDTGVGIFRISVYCQSTSDLRRQQVNTFKNCLTFSFWLRVFKGKSGHYFRGCVMVPGNGGVSLMLHRAVPLATWSSGGVSNPGTKMGVVWKEC